MTNVESVKARSKNLTAKECGTMQDKLTIYAMECSSYRLAISKYADRFTLTVKQFDKRDMRKLSYDRVNY